MADKTKIVPKITLEFEGQNKTKSEDQIIFEQSARGLGVDDPDYSHTTEGGVPQTKEEEIISGG